MRVAVTIAAVLAGSVLGGLAAWLLLCLWFKSWGEFLLFVPYPFVGAALTIGLVVGAAFAGQYANRRVGTRPRQPDA